MARLTFAQFVHDQWSAPPALEKADFTGKTVVVVGANNGIGFEASCHFARMNPGKLILACRNAERGADALAKIQQETGCKNVELWMIDLTRFSSVREFVDKYEREGGRLDFLIANAGIGTHKYETTTDGWESTLQVNDLSTSLLILLLLPRMIQTARDHSTIPRVVIVASEVHFWTSIEQSIIDSGKILQTLSSIISVFIARELNERLSRTQHADSIVINSVNPGLCTSGLRKGVTGIGIYLMDKILATPAEQGSRQLVWGAVGDVGNEERLRGAYINRSEVVEASDFVISEAGQIAQVRIWDEIIATLAKVDPRIQTVSDSLLAPA